MEEEMEGMGERKEGKEMWEGSSDGCEGGAEFASDIFGILNEGFGCTRTQTVEYISLHQS